MSEPGPIEPTDPTDPAEPAERPESEPPREERPYTELFGLPAMILVFALIAVAKGILTGNLGFTIVGAVVAGGVLLVIGFAMTIANRE
jgi:hypothetical protein